MSIKLVEASEAGFGLAALVAGIANMRGKSPVIPLLAAAGCAAAWLYARHQKAASESAEDSPKIRWIIRDDLGTQLGIPLEKITKLLTAAGILHQVAQKGEFAALTRHPASLQPFPAPSSPFAGEQIPISAGKHSSIVLRKIGPSYYLLIEPNAPRSLKNFSEETRLEMKAHVRSAISTFQEVFGSSDYLEELVYTQDGIALQLYPCLNAQPGQVNIEAKDQRNLYFLSRGQIGKAGMTHAQAMALRGAIQQVTVNPNLPPRQEIDLPKQYSSFNWQAAGRFRINSLLQAWYERKLPIVPVAAGSGEQLPEPAAVVADVKPVHVKDCVFCSDKIDKETIFETDQFRVIFNARPYLGREEPTSRHLLLVTKRHLENSAAATDEELLAERKLIERILDLAQKIYPGMQCRIWKQQGIQANQTVPHFHTHMLFFRPDELPQYLLHCSQEVYTQMEPFVQQPSPQLSFALENAQQQQQQQAAAAV
jgi:diadenosine tetraphosphate (Ap4A) HIT family hydrolase